MRETPSRKQLTIIALIVAGVLLAVPLGFFIYKQAQQSKTAEEQKPLIGESRVDPVSGETLTESTRSHDSASKVTTLVGFNNLLDVGLGMEQYDQLEEKFMLLGDQRGAPISRASMYKNSGEKTYEDRGESRIWQIKFNMQLDEKEDYAATIEYTSLSEMTLKVFNKDRTELLYTL